MHEITRVLDAIGRGEPRAASELLPLVYGELRRLAAQRMAGEAPGRTLQGTALVHEAYLRLVGTDPDRPWEGRGHFFAAAAEAMRRILVEDARRRNSQKRGGDRDRADFNEAALAAPEPDAELLALDDALGRLAVLDPAKAELVRLRYFAGLTIPQAAEVMGISTATASRHWSFARAWLHREIVGDEAQPDG